MIPAVFWRYSPTDCRGHGKLRAGGGAGPGLVSGNAQFSGLLAANEPAGRVKLRAAEISVTGL